MKIAVTLINPQFLERKGTLTAACSFAACMVLEFENIETIADNDTVRILVTEGDPFNVEYGSPILITYHLTGDGLHGIGGEALLYVSKDGFSAVGKIGNVTPTNCEGFLLNVCQELARAIFKKLKLLYPS